MDSVEHNGPDAKSPARVSRRGFLGRTAVAGSTAAVSAALLAASEPPSGHGTSHVRGQEAAPPADVPGSAAPLSQQRAMLLQVARVGAVYPVELRAFWGPGAAKDAAPAKDHATAARVRAAERRASPKRLAQAKAGADALIEQGLLGVSQARLLDGIARHAATAGPSERKELVAFVALGAATLSDHFDPNADDMAEIWLGGLRWMHRHGKQPRPIRPRN